MALKLDRRVVDEDITNFMNTVQEAGVIVSYVGTTASGVAMDQSEKTVGAVAEPSGIKPVGMLLNTVVNLDLTRQHYNQHKDEVQLGGKVTVMTKGTVTTDQVYTGHTPAPGTLAYVGHSGLIAESDVGTDSTNASTTRLVGRWATDVDEDGFATLDVNLP